MLAIVKRVAVVLAILVAIAVVWWVTVGQKWAEKKINDAFVGDYVVTKSQS